MGGGGAGAWGRRFEWDVPPCVVAPIKRCWIVYPSRLHTFLISVDSDSDLVSVDASSDEFYLEAGC